MAALIELNDAVVDCLGIIIDRLGHRELPSMDQAVVESAVGLVVGAVVVALVEVLRVEKLAEIADVLLVFEDGQPKLLGLIIRWTFVSCWIRAPAERFLRLVKLRIAELHARPQLRQILH